ncbi:hypothetical protein [Dyella humicola]|uniref:hypothetical protein n=1 Tax=Dyella humicola TaxID=2992126 RepID=UPI0022554240|nr:hypothetical protein [Dyella humicola]
MLAHQQPRSIGSRAARNTVRLINVITSLILFVCYIALAWSQRNQGLRDLLARTLAVQWTRR